MSLGVFREIKARPDESISGVDPTAPFRPRSVLAATALIALLVGACSAAPTAQPIPLTATATATLTPQPTLTEIPPTRTPAPTPTACPGVFTSTPTADVTVHYMECSTARYQNEIDTAVQWGVDALTGKSLGKVDVYVFDHDFETLAKLENESTRRQGYQTQTLEQLKQHWGRGGGLSGADGTVLIYFGAWWGSIPSSEHFATVIHELIHVAQYHESIKNNFWASKFPVWWVEGTAEYYARAVIAEHQIVPLDTSPTLKQCNQTLQTLSDWATLDNNCLYTQGSKAGELFDTLFGQEKYWAVWNELQFNKFNVAFEKVTGITVSKFSDLFDSYRINKYQKAPSLPAQ